jgi:vacuolar iron transporter family protein
VGFLPLGAFVYDFALPDDVASPFAWSAALTGLAFLIVGAFKARLVDQPAWRSGLETLAVGGGAAVLAYVLGAAHQAACADARSGRRSRVAGVGR